MTNVDTEKLLEVARRIREMREIDGLTVEEMAEKTEVTIDDYLKYEAGQLDFPFTFIHKCSLAFGIGITDLLEGQSAHLSSYTVTRKGMGQETAKEDGINIQNLAPLFRKKLPSLTGYVTITAKSFSTSPFISPSTRVRNSTLCLKEK